jgi:BirA family biotin operon repressor/biotin-[acetyl-CoA-carboxylase] ligase
VTTPLDAALLRAGLAGTRWGPVAVSQRTGSTNADLLAGLHAGVVTPGTVAVAAEQVSGRGRLTRAWSSPPGTSVALSAAVRLPDGAAWTLLPLLAGVAVAEAVTALGAPARVKWPNDVLIGGLKCCGILVETASAWGTLGAVVGIGLNVSQDRAGLPVPTATSLKLAGVTVTREAAAAAVLARLDAGLAEWEAGGDVLGRYRRWSATLGAAVALTLGPGAVVQGVATAIADDGRLGLVTGGETRWFAAGDVQHLRPAGA